MEQRKTVGQIGEKVAVDFLRKKGYEILGTNYQNSRGRRLGEIDIIAREKESEEIVFVEVKTREYQKYKDTLPEENITRSKLRKLEKIANSYLLKYRLRDKPFRFDAVSIWLDLASRKAKVKHLRSICL
jgi:putative endonuclease